MKPAPPAQAAGEMVVVEVARLRPEADADIPFPRYMTPHAAGMDVCAALAQPLSVSPGDICLVPTGFAIALPQGFEAQIRPRSGLAIRHGIGIVNSPGTIDADYRGEIQIALINFGRSAYTVRRGDRIAQMVIARVATARCRVVERLEES